MDIGSKLKELRVLKGLTQEELADRAELFQGLHLAAGRDLTSPIHRHPDRYPSMPGHHHRRFLHRNPG